MTTKFSIELHSRGDLNDAFVRMITNHNEGKVNINLADFSAYGKCKFAEWPTTSPQYEFKYNVTTHSIAVYENKKLTVSITENEIHELENQDYEQSSRTM